MNGIIFNIKRYAIHDGPGIRVTFFMKGCPLACWWCHNPEGISSDIENIERVDRIGEKEFRVNENVGKSYRIESLVEIVEKERVFIEESDGGITFSGGEPLMQSNFLLEALKKFSKLGIHTCIDTSGHANGGVIESVLPYTDLFLFDIKHLNDSLHIKHTGVSNRLILSNFKKILDRGKDVIVRFPVIPGFNDDSEHLNMLRDFMCANGNLKSLDLLPYHKIGSSKYERLGMKYMMDGIDQPSVSRMNEIKGFFKESGLKVKIGG